MQAATSGSWGTTSSRWRLTPRLVALLALLALCLVAPSCCKDDEKKDEGSSSSSSRDESANEGEASLDDGEESEEPVVVARPAADPPPASAEEEPEFDMGEPAAPSGGTDAPAAGGESAPATPRRVEVTASFLKVDGMLEPADVWKSLDYKGLLQHGEFVGQAPSKTYNAMRLATENGGFGVALQVWKPGSATAGTRRFDDLYKNSIGGQRSKDVGTLAFRSEHHGLRSVVFLDQQRSTVAWVTCEAKLCSFEQLADLSRRIQRKL